MKPYKTDCFNYTEVHDMGACISQCTRYRQLGKCPCDNCTDYISNKEAHLAVQDYVRNKKGKPHWLKLTPNQKRSTYFICSRCMERCVCINLDENKVNHCNYKFCPWCGEKMEVEE